MDTKIKVCGITSEIDAKLLLDLRVDFIGLNFFSKSPRFLDKKSAREIFKIIQGKIFSVGVFVNEEIYNIKKILEEIPLDYLQFHGDESPDVLAKFTDCKKIKAFRIDKDFDFSIIEKFKEVADYFLIDAYSKNAFGGTGQTIEEIVLEYYPKELWTRTFLAGGLNPDNVRDKVKKIQPFAVDVASGVESSVGKKDEELLKKFINEVRIV